LPRRAPIGVVLAIFAMLACVAPAGASAATFTVNAVGDHPADACDPGPGDCTLRDALAAANADPGTDTITLPAGTYALSEGFLAITGPVTISGPATAQPSVTIDAAYSDRFFDVSASAGAVTIAHVRITHGQTNDLLGGSGVLQRGGTVTLDHDIFDALSNNLSGGALLLQSGTMNLIDTEVSGTHAHRGGGLYVAGGAANVDRTLWLDNDGTTGGGGAIYNAGGTLSVTNSTFAANTANSARGGAIYAAASTALKNVTFEANSASGSGGGGSALWADVATTTANVLFGHSSYQDNCGGVAPTDLGGSLDTAASCGLGPASSERPVQLGPLELGGGSARSLLPWAGSAGIDGGANGQCADIDQRRTVRPHSPANPCDVGAVEGSADTPAPPPLIAPGDAHDATQDSIALDVGIDRRGVPTTYTVEYGLTSAYGFTSPFGDAAVPFGTGVGTQVITGYPLTDLASGTTYHYRFVATSAGGTTNGADRTFTTVGPPQVTTRPASDLTETSATLNGTINPAGDDTLYRFEYGPTTGYGSSTPPRSAGAGLTELAVTAVLSDLSPGSTWHFRLVATNEFSSGDVAGADRSFTVPAATPAPTPEGKVTTIATATPQPTPTAQPPQGSVVRPVSGKVLVRLPGSKRFVELDATTPLRFGSILDTKHGVVELSTISKSGKRETARFSEGIFKVTQSLATTDLTLVEALASCKRGKAAASAKKPKSRRLWGDGSGTFRTRGQYSAATVRGTKWLVQDSCAGTLTKVVTGAVMVRDNVLRKSILVRAGKRYLARPRG
jgi:CSLREA domain-containing protein